MYRILMVIILSSSVASCSIWNPYQLGDTTEFEPGGTLKGAVIFAETTRKKYHDAIVEHTAAERAIGVLLTGAAATGVVLGIRGGRSGQLTALSASSGGLFAAGSFLVQRPRLGTYMLGIEAIGCTLDRFGPAITSTDRNLGDRFVQLRRDRDALRALIAPGTADFFVLAAARNAIDKTNEVIAAHGPAMAALQLAGRRLYEGVHKIHANVSKALLASEPDLRSFVANLGDLLSTGSGLVIPVPAEVEQSDPQTDVSGQSDTGGTDVNKTERAAENAEIERATQKLREDTASFMADAALLKELPSDDALSSCEPFIEIRPMRLLPQPTLTVRPGAAAALQVRGGKQPYSAGFVGEKPKDDTVLKVDLNEAKTGFDVTAGASSPEKSYTLSVEDSAGTTESIIISVRK